MSIKFILLTLLQLTHPALLVKAQNVEDQKAYMEAQIELLKKEADLNAAMKTLSQVAGEALPSIVSIGVRGALSYARLLMPNGATVIYSAGEPIKKGLTLLRIEERAVWVQVESPKGIKKALSLEFAQVAPAQTYVPSSSFGILPNGGAIGGAIGGVLGDPKGGMGVVHPNIALPDASPLGLTLRPPSQSSVPSDRTAPVPSPAQSSSAAPAWMSRRTR